MKVATTLFVMLSTTAFAASKLEQSIGFYSSGSLQSASQLPDFSDKWKQLFPARDRSYANRTLINAVKRSATLAFNRNPDSERIQVSDFSSRRGGKLSGHASHQNGLDVDVVYLRHDRGEQDINGDRGLEENFVINGQVTSNFDVERNWELLKELVSNNDVNRIFVDEEIKNLFCEHNQDETDLLATETLRRMRPWPYHDDHFHLRLKCPESQTLCEDQNDPPSGDSCFVAMTLTNEVAP